MEGRWRRRWGVLKSGLVGERRTRHWGSVAGAELIVSPINGLRGSYFYYVFYVSDPASGRQGGDEEVDETVGAAAFGGDLLVRSNAGVVLVPEGQFEVRFSEYARGGRPVDRALPAGLEWLRDAPAGRRGPLWYRQYALLPGDAVELRARLEAAPAPAGGGPYRRGEAGGPHDFVARGEGGRPIVVIDRSDLSDAAG